MSHPYKGFEPEWVKGGISMDMRLRFNKVVSFNETDQIITVEAGMSGPKLEQTLNQAGREIMQSEAGCPSVFRLSDPEETAIMLRMYWLELIDTVRVLTAKCKMRGEFLNREIFDTMMEAGQQIPPPKQISCY